MKRRTFGMGEPDPAAEERAKQVAATIYQPLRWETGWPQVGRDHNRRCEFHIWTTPALATDPQGGEWFNEDGSRAVQENAELFQGRTIYQAGSWGWDFMDINTGDRTLYMKPAVTRYRWIEVPWINNLPMPYMNDAGVEVILGLDQPTIDGDLLWVERLGVWRVMHENVAGEIVHFDLARANTRSCDYWWRPIPARPSRGRGVL